MCRRVEGLYFWSGDCDKCRIALETHSRAILNAEQLAVLIAALQEQLDLMPRDSDKRCKLCELEYDEAPGHVFRAGTSPEER